MSDDVKKSSTEWIRGLEQSPRTLVEVERPRPEVAVVRLADPDNHNALSGPLSVQLRRALEEAVADHEIRAVVLTAKGPFFSVGGDWRLMVERAHTYTERDEGTTGLWYWIRTQFGGIARLITQSDKVFIAALNGDAAGVALAWALNCDLIAAVRDARLVTAFGRIGLVPEVGTNWVLTRRLGYARAFEVFLTGKPITGAEAAELGLVNKAVAPNELDAVVRGWCDAVCERAEHVVRMTKPLMRAAADMTWQQAILTEEFAEPSTFTTRAHQEAIRSLVGKQEKALAQKS